MEDFEERLIQFRTIFIAVLISFYFCVSHARGDRRPESTRNLDPVLQWNQITIDVIRGAGDIGPGFPSRSMAIVHASIFDTVNAIRPTAESYLYHQEAPRATKLELAVAGAASSALVALYPTQKNLILAKLLELLSQCPGACFRGSLDHLLSDSSFDFGEDVAAVILASRQNDGSSIEPPYNPVVAPGVWLPTLPDFTPAWGTAWGEQKLFLIADRFSYFPPPPPPLNSTAYAEAVNEVQILGRFDSSVRTADQTLTALFWSYDSTADGSPITLYNENIQVIARQQKNTVTENARLFALANLAMADAGIVCWLAKYDYILWRPVQAIREAAEDGNSLTVPDANWLPLGIASGPFMGNTVTPPFPAYVSGHSTFGAAVYETLRQFYRKDTIGFTLTSRDTPGIERSYASFTEAELENGRSRIYLGVHYSFDNLNGLALGRSVAKEVVNKLPLLHPRGR